MTIEQAYKICGRQPAWALQNMCKALAMHSWLNTEEEWERFEAAARVLGKRTPSRARAVLQAHMLSQLEAGL
jgi:hypothetical protein